MPEQNSRTPKKNAQTKYRSFRQIVNTFYNEEIEKF